MKNLLSNCLMFIVFAIIELIITGYALFMSSFIPCIVAMIISLVCSFFINGYAFEMVYKISLTVALVISVMIFSFLSFAEKDFFSLGDDLPKASYTMSLIAIGLATFIIWQ